MKKAAVWAVMALISNPVFAADSPQVQELSITRIVPEGEDVREASQIVIQFNRPVVPVGVMERSSAEIPVEITPPLNCEWRWLNTSALSCNLKQEESLKMATKYNIKVKPGIKAEDGATIANEYQTSFVTELPRAEYANFENWESATKPRIATIFNYPVTQKSVLEHVFIESAGKRYAVTAERNQYDEEKAEVFNGSEIRYKWNIIPKDDLPEDAVAVLKIEPGLVIKEGVETNTAAEVREFNTFPAPKFLGVKCSDNTGAEIITPPGGKSAGLCNPMQPVRLSFSAPVSRVEIGKFIKFNPDFTGGKKDLWGEEQEMQIYSPHNAGRTYDIWVPAGLKAGQTYKIESMQNSYGFFSRIWRWIKSIFVDVPATGMKDAFGRPIKEAFTAEFATDNRLPNFEIGYSDSVLEKETDSELPFYVNNLQSYRFDYEILNAAGVQKNRVVTQTVPGVKNIQFAVPLGIRELLQGKSGVLYGLVSTTPSVDKGENKRNYRVFSQVTPYQVHAKVGHFNTVVWVTELATGKPVSGATLSVYRQSLDNLQPQPAIATSATDKNGLAKLPGSEVLSPDTSDFWRYEDDKPRLMLKVQKAEDMALLPLESTYEADLGYSEDGDYIYSQHLKKYKHLNSWGTTAQGIYRAGDAIQYKIYVRNQDVNSLVPAPKTGYNLRIIDPQGKVVLRKKGISLNEFGAFDGEYQVPKNAPIGWYRFKLTTDFAGDGEQEENEDENEYSYNEFEWQPISVLVSDFTPAPFKVTNEVNGQVFKAGDKLDVTTHASLHSGGAYTDAVTRVTAVLDARWFSSQDPVASKFRFDSFEDQAETAQIFQETRNLNEKGELVTPLTLPKQKIAYGKLTIESAVQDDRGKNVAAVTTADYAGVDRLVGLRSPQWVYEKGKPGRLEYIVVDVNGKPVVGTDVDIIIESENTKAAKVKGPGNSYITEYKTEWVKAGECSGKSELQPGVCQFTPEKSGSYRATAAIKDSNGTAHITKEWIYATGNDYVLWNQQNDYGLTIIPEKKEYKVGDKARYLVKNPYPGATALVTIERYGVIDSFVQKLEGSSPVIEFEVKPDYLPGYYLSVIVQSPRVDKPIENQVDLGKPTFRMGYVQVPVKDKYKEMKITATAAQPVYRPGEHVKVKLHTEPKFPSKKEPVEIAVAVLDESVFDLVAGGRDYFDPYLGFFQLEGLDLKNYSLLTRLIGRQKFEKKGANPGGDGGSDSMRSVFKFVSYWNPSIKTDANGNAEIEFQAPDNLTGWRVLAIATTPTDRMGLGEGNFKVNKPTEIRPVMPNQVMEGDEFKAGFNIMNRSDKAREIEVSIKTEGDVVKTGEVRHKVKLEPFKRETIWLPVTAKTVAEKHDVQQGEVRFTVTAGDSEDKDGLVHKLVVNKSRSLITAANYGTTTEGRAEDSIAIPKEIYKDAGGVSVTFSPSVISSVEGAFRYMRDYPYICWEQKLTKAVTASQYLDLKQYIAGDFTWDEAVSLPKATLAEAANFQTPNGGMSYYGGGDDYADPYLSAYTALAFNWLKASGYEVPVDVEKNLHAYLLNILRKDELPSYYSEGMSSSVRAVALSALSENGEVTLSDLKRYQPYLPQMTIFGKSQFLMAATNTEGAKDIETQVAKNLLGSSNQTGGKFSFEEKLDDSYSWLLPSSMKNNCAVLSSLTAMAESEEGNKLVGDIPFKLVRTITQGRNNRDYWENTQENLFCLNALVDYSRAYESVTPQFTATASLDGLVIGMAKFDALTNPEVKVEKPFSETDPGRKGKVVIEKQGEGRLYYSTRVSYAPTAKADKPVNSGIEIKREYSIERGGKWEILKEGEELKRGNIIRADIYISTPGVRNFVVVDDPVPGGFEPVNRDLATTSTIDADKAEESYSKDSSFYLHDDWIMYNQSRWSFYLQELRHDSVRYYSDYLPQGNYHLTYVMQAIVPGKFRSMPVKAEEMYSPDVFGKGITREIMVND